MAGEEYILLKLTRCSVGIKVQSELQKVGDTQFGMLPASSVDIFYLLLHIYTNK